MDTTLIAYAAPAFLLLILAELAWGLRRGRNNYRVNDAINSISLGLLSTLINVLTAGVGLFFYLGVQRWAPWNLPLNSVWTWAAAFLLFDFCYYWHHRLGHEVALLWATHSVHHQSEEYNLSTALRQTGSTFLLGWAFYLPMALVGIPAAVYAAVYSLNLLYQFWIHTEHVGRLGWYDRVFGSPSNHRVHHGQNAYCLDKNYGGFLMLWDRLFGTFVDERAEEPPIYGVRGQLASWNPLYANLKVYLDLWRQAGALPRWQDKLKVWFKPPGWTPEGVNLAWDATAFRKYDTTIPRRLQAYAVLQFGLSYVAGVAWLLKWPAGGVVELVYVLAGLSMAVLALGEMLARPVEGCRWEAARLALIALLGGLLVVRTSLPDWAMVYGISQFCSLPLLAWAKGVPATVAS